MLSITLAQLKADITPKLKGTSLRQISDFYGVAATAANRMLSRIDTEETRRTITMSSPFFDNVNDYSLVTDFKRGIDIRPQENVNRQNMPGNSDWGQITAKQFNERLDSNSFSVKWNNMVRSLRAQQVPIGNVQQMDSFDVTVIGLNAVSNGTWTAEGDASGLYAEILNFIEGNGSLGMNLSGVTGAADIVNSTAAVSDMSLLRYENSSFLYYYIPVGFSSRFTNFKLRRGSTSGNYKEVTITTKADGTSFTDGWNFLRFDWNQATTTGTPDDTKNTYRRLGVTYDVSGANANVPINGCLIDNWTDSLGMLYEMEYYSEYMFRTAAGVWIARPTLDTDLVNVDSASYEILKTEMMVDITQNIRTGATRDDELADWRLMLNGQPQSRYVKDPSYHGLYADYLRMFPSSAITTITRNYNFDC